MRSFRRYVCASLALGTIVTIGTYVRPEAAGTTRNDAGRVPQGAVAPASLGY